MGTHFGAIGIPGEDSEESVNALLALAAGAETIGRTSSARVTALTDSSGARLTFTLDGEGAIKCATPSFAGTTRLTALAGSFAEHQCPYETPVIVDILDDTGETAHPLAMQPEDVALWRENFTSGEKVLLNVTAFAETLEVFADESEYRASGTPMAVRSLIPSGMFGPGAPAGGDWAVTPRALISGTVRSAMTLVNQATGRAFWHVLAESYSDSYDMVVDPSDLDEPPAPGSIISGQFWLACRRVTK